jgi:hypothetical protein
MCRLLLCEDCGDSEYDILKERYADLESLHHKTMENLNCQDNIIDGLQQQVEALEKTIHNLMKPPQEI